MAIKHSEEDLGKKPPYTVFGILGFVLTVIGIFALWKGYEFNTSNVKETNGRSLGDIGQYGEYLVAIAGSVFSLVGVFFLFLAFKQQGDSFRLERFENHFFELMKIYRENVAEMEYEKVGRKENESIKGRSVFISINDEFQLVYRFLRLFFNDKSKSLKPEHQEIISVANLIVFFGLSSDGVNSIKYVLNANKFARKYPDAYRFITIQLPTLKLKNNEFRDFFIGHQVRLGHYFRHLFQTVLFVHQKEFLTRQEKYDYIKILRGQMSTYEQAVFFYNSLSHFGMVWEHKYRDLDYNFKVNQKTGLRYEVNGKEVSYNDLLITEYRLIKNIPVGFTGDINPKDFYKLLPFEGESSSE